MTNRKWVMLDVPERWHHCIVSYVQNKVSDILLNSSLIVPCPMTNRRWVYIRLLMAGVWSHLALWTTASEWQHLLHSKLVTCSVITEGESHCTFCQMEISWQLIPWWTDSEWHSKFFWMAVSWHLILWPTLSQRVSYIGHFWSLKTSFAMTNRGWVTFHILLNGSLIAAPHPVLWPTESEWYSTFSECSLITSCDMANRKWATLHIIGDSWHSALWLTEGE